MIHKANLRINKFLLFSFTFVFILIFGLISSEYLVRFGQNHERKNLLHLTETATAAIDIKQVMLLKGISEDAQTTAYKILKKQIQSLHTHVSEAEFIYIMKLKGNKVVFLVDSEPDDSEDASFPGDPYDEASNELIRSLKIGESMTEGPLKDAWGVWVSGIVPIKDPVSQSVIAILGIDISAKQWQKAIFTYRFLGYALTGALLFLVFIFYIYIKRIHRANQAILQEVSELQFRRVKYFSRIRPCFFFLLLLYL